MGRRKLGQRVKMEMKSGTKAFLGAREGADEERRSTELSGQD